MDLFLTLTGLSADEANAAAEDIENSGNINYTNAKGATVTVNVGDVSVDD